MPRKKLRATLQERHDEAQCYNRASSFHLLFCGSESDMFDPVIINRETSHLEYSIISTEYVEVCT